MPERSQSIQFQGVADVVAAFKNIRVPRWAIFQNKSMIEKYEDENIDQSINFLNDYLLALQKSKTAAIYRLCTYEQEPAGGSIKPSTECDRSFSFVVNAKEYGGYGSIGGFEQQIIERLDRIEAKQALEEEPDENEESEKVSGITIFLNKMLENPQVQQRIGYIIDGILNQIVPMNTTQNMQPQPAAVISGVEETAEAQADLINEAIQKLWNVDKALGTHLQKIADIAEKNPVKYKQILSMLSLL